MAHAYRGLKTAVVEREDFGSGTSSKSTKLVHGGVRYLEKAVFQLDIRQLKLVFEALQERRLVLENAPHLTSALPILTVRALGGFSNIGAGVLRCYMCRPACRHKNMTFSVLQ